MKDVHVKNTAQDASEDVPQDVAQDSTSGARAARALLTLKQNPRNQRLTSTFRLNELLWYFINTNAQSTGPPYYFFLPSQSPESCNSVELRFSDAPHAPVLRRPRCRC